MKCRAKLKKRTPSQSEPQVYLLNQKGKKNRDLWGYFSGGQINIKGHSTSLTHVDVAGGKCSVQSSAMDCRLQLRAVIVSDQSVPCSCLVHLSEQEDPGSRHSWGKITAMAAEMELWVVAKSPAGPTTTTTEKKFCDIFWCLIMAH